MSALLLDLALVALVTVGLAAVLDFILGGRRVGSAADALVDAAAVFTIMLFPFAWFVVGEGWFRTTPGKALLGLEVTDPTGERLGLRRAALRLLYRLSPVGIIGAIGLLGRRRAWHEHWTDSVVRRRGEPIGVEAEPDVVPAAARVRPAGARRPATQRAPRFASTLVAASAPAGLERSIDEGAVHSKAGDEPAAKDSLVDQPAVDEVQLVEEVGPTAILLEAAVAGAGLPATSSVECRCAELGRLSGEEAATYARSHLLTVRRWPDAGHFALICPATRLAWAASEGWGADGQVTLARVPSLAAAGPDANAN